MNPPGRMQAYQPWGDVWNRAGWRVQVHCVSGTARVLNDGGKSVFAGAAQDCLAFAGKAAPSGGSARAVILLHGIANDFRIMARIGAALTDSGWAVANVGYASMRAPLAAHAAAASHIARALTEDGARDIALVGHSLGGLIARAALELADDDYWRPGRLVLIGSPAQGCSITQRLSALPFYRSVFGPCGDALTYAGAARIPCLRAAGMGVIAGGTGNHGFNWLLDGDNDGRVRVAETRLASGEDAFLLLRARHNALATHPETVAACRHFLSTGRFAA